MLSGKFNTLTIRLKLLIIIVGICAGALLCSALLEIIINWVTERDVLAKRMLVTTEMVSLQSRAALEFLDPNAAREDLAALAANPLIRRACLYNETGSIFASYTVSQNTMPADMICPPYGPQRTVMYWDRVEFFYDVMHNGRKLGSLYLERDLSDMFQSFAQQVLEKLLIIGFVIALVWPLSSYFQRMISQPVIRLAAITRRFAQDRSQQVKAVKTSNDEIGELVDAFNAMMDEIRRNEQQLGQAIEELTSSNTELERFAYSCSHDLQEPLRMISNYTALLEKRGKEQLDDNMQQYLHIITDGAARMRELINGILAYARVGHQGEPMQQIDANALVEYVLQNLSETLKERQATIHKTTLPTVNANRTLLLQIFQNLISNAAKFCTGKPEVWVSARRDGAAWEFSVKDNGIGIEPQYHDRVFEIFKRLNRRDEFQGSGIGLAIFKKSVEYHGGRVWIESKPDQGTTFFFTIPDHKE